MAGILIAKSINNSAYTGHFVDGLTTIAMILLILDVIEFIHKLLKKWFFS